MKINEIGRRLYYLCNVVATATFEVNVCTDSYKQRLWLECKRYNAHGGICVMIIAPIKAKFIDGLIHRKYGVKRALLSSPYPIFMFSPTTDWEGKRVDKACVKEFFKRETKRNTYYIGRKQEETLKMCFNITC